MTALTIAGFDPSSGAGITADLQVFAAHTLFGTSAITALTVQSTLGVARTELVAPAVIGETLRMLEEDLPARGIKVGMLGSAGCVIEVVRYLKRVPGRPVVLDPVIRSSSGALLLESAGLKLLREELLSLATVITPNISELELLAGQTCPDVLSQQAAAEALHARHGCAVIVTGGDSEDATDLVFAAGEWTTFRGEHINSHATHGTGCAFSSAVLCGLLQGENTVTAALKAKEYVAQAIRTATPRGHGKGPMNLLWPILGHSRAG